MAHANGVPFNGSWVVSSGNIAADMTANVMAECAGRLLATRLYEMTDDPGMNFMASEFDGQRGLRTDRATPGAAGYREYMPQGDVDEFKRLAKLLASAMTGVNGRKHTELPFFAYGTFFGTSIDYAHSRHYVDTTRNPIHALHVEWGDNALPNPAWPVMEGQFMPEVVAGLVSFCVKV